MLESEWWKNWITNFCKTTIGTYKNEPGRIEEDFASEIRVKDDYKGRVLLELLQNCDDAQIPEGNESTKVGDSHVILWLTKDAFYCANGGYPITAKGLDAICRLSHSPKKDKSKYIGEKGLGFKSVLCFTDSPEIHSQGLHCMFSKSNAISYMSDIGIEAKSEISQVALFRFPVYITDDKWNKDLILKDLLSKSATVIKIPISKENYSILKEKLYDIKATILLFLNQIRKIEIKVENINGEIKEQLFEIENNSTCSGDTLRSYVLKDGMESMTNWDVFSFNEDINGDFIGNNEDSTLKGVNTCRMSFAIQKNCQGEYIPIRNIERNYIECFFRQKKFFHCHFFSMLRFIQTVREIVLILSTSIIVT